MQEKNYSVEIAPEIYVQLENIKNYISNVLFSPATAERRLEQIFDGLGSLKKFPERGFNADERFGKEIKQGENTRAIPIVSGKYLVFYVIDEMNSKVLVHMFVPTDSDYIKLFL